MFKKTILFLVPFLFCLVSLLSLFPVWLGDLFSHFRMFWTVFGLILFIIYVILFNKKKIQQGVMLFAILALGINLYHSFSFWTNAQTYEYLFFGSPNLETLYHSNPDENVIMDTTVKSLLLMNVLSSNTNYEKVRELIKNTDADFVVIIELNKKWENELTELNESYPNQFTEVREDNFGMGIYSKVKYKSAYQIYSNPITQSQLTSGIPKSYKDEPNTLEITGLNENLRFLIVHPIPPINSKAYKQRNTHIASFLHRAGSRSYKKTLFLGDFNCSPFSADYKNFLKQSGLKDSQENYGFQPTWRSNLPFLMQTQLDHVWHSEDIEILHRQTLPIAGSDHKAVLVVFK